MFGEKMIVGEFRTTVDNKGRFNIPKKTGREPGEEMITLYNPTEDCVELCSKDNYMRIITNVAESKDLDYIMLHRDTLIKYKKLILRTLFESTIDKQGRMWGDFNVLKRYGFAKESQIYILGQGNYVELYPNESSLETQLRKRNMLR